MVLSNSHKISRGFKYQVDKMMLSMCVKYVWNEICMKWKSILAEHNTNLLTSNGLIAKDNVQLCNSYNTAYSMFMFQSRWIYQIFEKLENV